MTDSQKQRLMEIAAEAIFEGFGAIEIYNRFTVEFGLVKVGVYAAALRLVEAI